MSLITSATLAMTLTAAADAGSPSAVPGAERARAVLLERHPAERERIERGVRQAASLWRAEDGDLAAFALEHFLPQGPALDATFERLEVAFEQLQGHLLEVGRELRRPTEVEVGPMQKVDPLLASWDVGAHVNEDLFTSKLAFVILLNFPLTTLEERTAGSGSWTRRQWAEARLTQKVSRRLPATVAQQQAQAAAAADLYISGYNLWMHHVLARDGRRLFPAGQRLLSHWNLRDELKAQYAEGPAGLERQQVLLQVMERIVTQTIPRAVVDEPRLDWNPFTNEVRLSPAAEVEPLPDGKPAQVEAVAAPEPDTRYQVLLAQFRAARAADPYSPAAPTAIDRAFALSAELPEARVRGLLLEVLGSELVAQVGQAASARLGRPLGPQDLWYSGFLPRAAISEAELDRKVRQRYPTAEAFARDLPRILRALAFPADRARQLAASIKVDAARGSGHALQAERRGDFPRLRTRVEAGGMNYKGYNIGIHELGHNVEQFVSLYDVDHTLLAGVPNTAFTEALAFVFQARDLELLGLSRPSAEQERLRVLNDFWATWEIAGVGLVDLDVWRWMYEHPQATPAQLKAATVEIATRVWDAHYRPVLGGGSTPLLGIYSHMVSYPLYLFNYPLGHLIAFQVEEQLQRSGNKVGPEVLRMARFGAVSPDAWMVNASGKPVSAGPLLEATRRALSGR